MYCACIHGLGRACAVHVHVQAYMCCVSAVHRSVGEVCMCSACSWHEVTYQNSTIWATRLTVAVSCTPLYRKCSVNVLCMCACAGHAQ